MATGNQTHEEQSFGYDATYTNNTLLPPETEWQLSMVTLSTLLLAAVCLCGFLVNISLLASILWKRGTLCCLQYALPINLLVSNLLFCLFWAPVEMVRILLSYNHGLYSRALYYYTTCLFIHCIVLLFVTVLFIVIYQVCSQIGDNKHCLDCVSISGLIGSWLGGILVTVLQGTEVRVQLVVVVLVVIGAAMLLLGAVVLWRKNQLSVLAAESERLATHRDSTACSTSESRSVTKTDHEEKESKSSQLCLNLGLGGKGRTAASDPQPAIPPTRGISFAKGSKQKVSQDNDSEISEDEDSFDTKMRLQFRALASRRHTIGNVGENPFGQSSPFGPRPGAAKANNYKYVRKWSVDVTALQDQLENPKRHGGSLPFQELAMLPEREPLVPEKSVLKKKPHAEVIMEENANHKNSLKDNKDNCTETQSSEESNQNKQNSTKTTSFSDTIVEKDDNNQITKHDSIEIDSTMIPTIVVNGNNAENLKSCEQQTDREINRQNNKTLSRYVRVTKCVFCLLSAYTLSLLPLFIYTLLWRRAFIHYDQNVLICVTSLAPLQAIIHPFILYHMEQKIKQTFRRLRLRVTHWRFVCYCNTCTLQRQHGGGRGGESVTEDPDEDKSMTKV